MSTLQSINLKHPSSASNNIALDSSGNAAVANNVTVTGTGSVGGNLSFNSGYGSSAVAYGCRAWVNFNGTGTVAMRASGNVSSITDFGVGDYGVNFTNNMPDVNYVPLMTAQEDTLGPGNPIIYRFLYPARSSQQVNQLRVNCQEATSGAMRDVQFAYVAVVR